MSKDKFEWDDKLVGKYANYVHDNVAAGQAVFHSVMIEQFKKENSPKPLFTTEDGVDYYENEKKDIYAFHTGTNHWHPDLHPEYYTQLSNHYNKFFASKTKAEEYILMNKPCLSLQDLLSVWHRGDSLPQNESVYASSPMFQDFKELAKQKIK